MRIQRWLLAAVIGAGLILGATAPVRAFDKSKKVEPENFAEPPKEYRQQAWLSYNLSRATEENMATQVKAWADRDMPGFYLGLGGGNTSGLSDEYIEGARRGRSETGVAFLSKEYFDLYAKIIEMGIKNGNPPIVFYDEVGYPSGMAGGYLYSKYPQYGAKSLEKVEKDFEGPAKAELEIPEGITVGAVMMNLDSRELVDVSEKINAERKLITDIPPGRWKLMGFYLNPRASLGQGTKSGYVDYLDAEAVQAYIQLCYQPHYDNLKKYFGTVLKITQYDEPAMHVVNGKAWTPKFNQGFEKLYGFNPMKYYPALWYDIGPDTVAIRNALWGYRAKLWSESYIKQMDDWCREHGIMFGGHLDQEEITNPVGVNGDLMLAFKYQAAPAIDDIWWWGRSNRTYKVIQSAAYNWDKPVFMAETYAAYRLMNEGIVYKVAMDQATMGANFQVGALPRAKTPASDRFIGRLSYMLQHGRHVADVAILYPIESLQAAYRFGDWGDARGAGGNAVAYAREGGIVPPEIDYMELGEQIFRGLRQDYTFLHPSVLKDRCKIEGNKLILDNPVNREEYSVLIVPGGPVLSVESAKKIKAFYDAGGTVIATKVLANRSAEKGQDSVVRQIMGDVFGLPEDGPMVAQFNRRTDEFMVHFLNRNQAGGKAYFLPDYTEAMLQAIMQQAVPTWDVAIAEPIQPVIMGPGYDGSLTYIHKFKDGRNLYLFANSTDKPVQTQVALRGGMKLAAWNPMDGKMGPMESTIVKNDAGVEITTAALKLDPVSAMFYVQEP